MRRKVGRILPKYKLRDYRRGGRQMLDLENKLLGL
jgi:hypothetical protein